MRPEQLEWRMYGLVPYNISPIQQGIQYGHAVQEYNNKVAELKSKVLINEDYSTEDQKIIIPFHKWANQDKTFIILNGGTTNKATLGKPIIRENESNTFYKGTLNNHLESLRYNNIHTATFFEPDLGDQLTAVVFLVDERVFDRKKYPDFKEYLDNIPTDDRMVRVDTMFENYWRPKWIESLGGEKNVWLREYLSQFRLA